MLIFCYSIVNDLFSLITRSPIAICSLFTFGNKFTTPTISTAQHKSVYVHILYIVYEIFIVTFPIGQLSSSDVHHALLGVSGTSWCIMHASMHHALLGVSCIRWCIMHSIVYHALLGVLCTPWCIMHSLVYYALLGVSCTRWCIMHSLVYYYYYYYLESAVQGRESARTLYQPKDANPTHPTHGSRRR